MLPLKDGKLPDLNVFVLDLPSRFRKVRSVTKTAEMFESNIQRSILNQRAWILQEQVLSRKRLHFGKDQLFWICPEVSIAEDGTHVDD